MAEEPKVESVESKEVEKTRRSFVKTAAQVAVTAPAVSLLLSQAAQAQIISLYAATQNHVLDDFASGNTHEDLEGAETANTLTLDDPFETN